MDIAGFLKTSLIEWPGKITSVIFTSGCNFRCPFCHNADIVLGRGFSRIPEKRIFADLLKRKNWIDAVAITGGEPTLQADLPKFLKQLKELKLETMLETNGSSPQVVKKLIENKLVDYWAMDIKGNFDNYQNFVGGGGDVGDIRETMDLIIKSGVEYQFRTTVVPELHNLENLKELATSIREMWEKKGNEKRKRWFLQQFRPLNTLDKKYLKIKPYSDDKMKEFCRELQKIIPQTFLRGV